jgi:hypothetical protein
VATNVFRVFFECGWLYKLTDVFFAFISMRGERGSVLISSTDFVQLRGAYVNKTKVISRVERWKSFYLQVGEIALCIIEHLICYCDQEKGISTFAFAIGFDH